MDEQGIQLADQQREEHELSSSSARCRRCGTTRRMCSEISATSRRQHRRPTTGRNLVTPTTVPLLGEATTRLLRRQHHTAEAMKMGMRRFVACAFRRKPSWQTTAHRSAGSYVRATVMAACATCTIRASTSGDAKRRPRKPRARLWPVSRTLSLPSPTTRQSHGFVQASQMLRILVCVLAIFILSVAFGMVALLSLKTVALLGSTPLGFVRDAALRRVECTQLHAVNITLQPDKARAEVWIPAETWKHSASTSGMPRLDEEFYSKIDLEVFARVSPGTAAQSSLLEARAASAFVVSRQLHRRHDRPSQASFGRGRIRGTRAHLARSSALSFETNKTLSGRSRRSAGWSTSLLARARARKCQYLLAELANALQPHAFAAGAPRWQRLQVQVRHSFPLFAPKGERRRHGWHER